MIKMLIPFLKAGHAFFNGGLFIVILYQGFLGWQNRRKRLAGEKLDSLSLRRHRTMGPFLAIFMPGGYLAGLVLAWLDHGTWSRYPLHLAVGTALVVAVSGTWVISRKIKADRDAWRTAHFQLGIAILVLFAGQVLLGLGILLG